MRGAFWGKEESTSRDFQIFGVLFVLKVLCGLVFDENDDDDVDDEESGLGSNEWPLGSDTFPRDLRHPSLQKRPDPLTTGCIVFILRLL